MKWILTTVLSLCATTTVWASQPEPVDQCSGAYSDGCQALERARLAYRKSMPRALGEMAAGTLLFLSPSQFPSTAKLNLRLDELESAFAAGTISQSRFEWGRKVVRLKAALPYLFMGAGALLITDGILYAVSGGQKSFVASLWRKARAKKKAHAGYSYYTQSAQAFGEFLDLPTATALNMMNQDAKLNDMVHLYGELGLN